MDKTLLSTSSLHSAVLPGLTILLGTGGLAGGIYALQSPFDWARQFGVITKAGSTSSFEQKAFIQAIGIRNLASGASLLSLTAFWQISSLCRNSPLASIAVKRTLGISLLVGTVVALGDSLVLSRLVEDGTLSSEAEGVTSDKSKGHMFMSLPILGLALGYLLT
ncbi:uncharacterized protein PV06_08601 [Exophiala oligosperma]|uniref:Uncharacterized protein n=2 Tax=Chaetothyriales TaxID=34395 RepID=A0A0D2AIX1_9EURO|nr:uncharacterized protein PV06_08601 [Exophiala oligosperma]KAJ9641292.1 hypothetical protein H2204_002970 [Knufia peltigerae]KIW40046.1 hypothetical protein PV06_08601 [Exophiala oligosperma]